MYKILANEINACVSIAHAPCHTYIMYKDEDNLTPEEWINLELTTHQMQPSFWIKQNGEICDSAVIVGTYMTPLTEFETVASQLADLAFGYYKKFNRFDDFTYVCTSKSLEFYPRNPSALVIRGKSLDELLLNHMAHNGHRVDGYVIHLSNLIRDTLKMLDDTYMTEDTPEIIERRRQQAIDAEYYTNEVIMQQ